MEYLGQNLSKHFISINTPRGTLGTEYYYDPHFTGEQTEAENNIVISSRARV